MPHPNLTPEDFGRITSQAMNHGFLLAARLLWPYFLALFVFAIIMAWLRQRIRRAERDAEYRRMATISKEVNDDESSGNG